MRVLLCLLLCYAACGYLQSARFNTGKCSRQSRRLENGICAGLAKSKVVLSLSRNGGEEHRPSLLPNAGVAFLFLPLTAELFPYLLSKVTDFSVEPLDRQRYILGLLLLKRVFLYSAAITGLDWMAKRSISDSSVGLGERLAELNEEMLSFSGSGQGMGSSSGGDKNKKDEGIEKRTNIGSDFNEQAAPLLAQLDELDGQQQALGLPILVALSLLASFAGLQLSGLATEWFQAQLAQNQAAVSSTDFSIDPILLQALSQLVSAITTIGVCTVFSKAEIQRLLSGLETASEKILGRPIFFNNIAGNATLVALLFSTIAVLNPVITRLQPQSIYWQGHGLWPVGNLVNLLLAVTISRAFQLSSLPLVLTALAALTAYDVFFVFGTQALTDGGQSIMEAVAMAKLQATTSTVAGAASAVSSSAAMSTLPKDMVISTRLTASASASATVSQISGALGSTWRPGLLQVNLNGKISDALGLGDVIFPSLLAGWALRYDSRPRSIINATAGDDDDDADDDSDNRKNRNIYGSALGGYALGCLLCELFQTGAGQPALLYVVPAMVGVMTSTNFDLLLDEQKRKELLEFDG